MRGLVLGAACRVAGTRGLAHAAFLGALLVGDTATAQWQPAAGTTALNMQALLSRGAFCFAGGATGAYRSTDSAASFAFSNTGNNAVGPTRGFASDASYVYTCTSQGVFRSADNGATWVAKSSGLTNLLSSGILQTQSNLFMVGPVGVFRSSNQGDSWVAAGLAGIDVRCITAIGGTLFVGTNSSGIYKSTNLGATWVAANNGLTSTTFRAIEAKGNTLFAGGQIGTGVFRSLDQGASWTLLGGGLPVNSYRGFASDNSLVVAGAFGAGVFYSVDNGDHWTSINVGLGNLEIFDLEIHQGHLVVATNTQGVFRFPISKLPFLEFGAGCPGAGGTPELHASQGSVPRLGSMLQLTLQNLPASAPAAMGALGLSSSTWGGVPLPADLGTLGMPGCTQFVSVDVATFLPAGAGTASWSIPVPAQSALVGTTVFLQALVLDATANAFGAVVTNAASATVIG